MLVVNIVGFVDIKHYQNYDLHFSFYSVSFGILQCVCMCLTACNVGDEGGFAPNIQNNEEGLSLNYKIM